MAHLRAPMPSDVLFSTDNVGGEPKTKKRSSRPQMFCFPPKNIGGGQIKKKINKKLVSRSGLSSKRCNAPLLSNHCATYGACAIGWPPLL